MESKRKNLIWLTIFSTLIAIGLHTYLTIKFYSLKFGLEHSNICNFGQKFNCDVATSSKYAALLVVPMALLGVLTNVVFLLFTTNGLFKSFSESRPLRYGYYLSLFILLTSVFMGGISLLYLTSYCPFCIATYVLSLVSFLTMNSCSDISITKHFKDDFMHLFRENKNSLYLLIAIPILAFLIDWNVDKNYQGGRLNVFIKESLSTWKTKKENSFDLQKGLSTGPSESPFTIVEFADYLCPHCKHAAGPLKTFAESHPQVKLIFKPYPLEGNCNPGIGPKYIGDGIKCRLAFASYCAEKEFKSGWEFHEHFFQIQEQLYTIGSVEKLDSLICDYKPEMCDKLKSCMNLEDTQNAIKLMAQEGKTAEVEGTPTIYVNGKKLEGGQNIMVLNSLFKELNL